MPLHSLGKRSRREEPQGIPKECAGASEKTEPTSNTAVIHPRCPVLRGIPPAVRILPMNARTEFKRYRDWKDVQSRFFLRRLLQPKRPPGKYWYRKLALRTPNHSVILFQYDSQIIAVARLISINRFRKPDEDGYCGAFHFDVKSIKVFDPIQPEIVSRYWREFKGFSHVRWILDPKRYPAFERELKRLHPSKSLKGKA